MGGLHGVKLTIALAACAALAAALASSAGGQGATPVRILFPAKCKNPVFQPKSIVVTCPGGGLVVEAIRWKEWTSSTGRGRGVAVLDNDRFPAKLVLTESEACNATDAQYTRLRLTYPRNRPPQSNKSISVDFPCA